MNVEEQQSKDKKMSTRYKFKVLLLSQKYIAFLMVLAPLSLQLSDFSALLVLVVCDVLNLGGSLIGLKNGWAARHGEQLKAKWQDNICYTVAASILIFANPKVYHVLSTIKTSKDSGLGGNILERFDSFLGAFLPSGRIIYGWYITNYSASFSTKAAIDANFQLFCILCIALLNVVLAQRYSRWGLIEAYRGKVSPFGSDAERGKLAIEDLFSEAFNKFAMTVVVLEICNYFLSFRMEYDFGGSPSTSPLDNSFSQAIYLGTYSAMLVAQWPLVGLLAEAAIIYPCIDEAEITTFPVT